VLLAEPVFLALLTSEPNGEGEILRIHALRPEKGGEPRTLERLAQPAGRLSLAQTRFTGLGNKELAGAPDLDEVLEELLEFSTGAGAWLVAGGETARTALRGAALSRGFPRGFGAPVLGVDELAAIVHPTLGKRGLSELLEFYELEPDGGRPDAGVIHELWAKLEDDLLKVPLPVIAEMNWLLSRTEHPLKHLLKAAEARAVDSQFAASMQSGRLSLGSLFKDYSEIIKRLTPHDEEEADALAATDPEEGVTKEDVAEVLGPGGPLSKSLKSYEDRPEQLELAGRIAEAFTEGRHILAEAGTGVGKSLAYLVPAVLFAKRAGRPVVISTHTKNLQSQLFHKDLPLLKKSLGVEFEAALLKGRPNYLCLRKFTYTLQEAAHELEDEERGALLPVIRWAAQTSDGDVAEMAAFSPEQNPALWDRLHTVGEDCLARQCPFYHRCFTYKARGLARGADVVVVNHALVFSDLNQESGALPPYHELIFDEAHTLEDVATEHLACEVTPRRVYKILHKLFRAPKGSSAGKGALPSLLFQLDQARADFPQEMYQSIHEHILEALQSVPPAEDAADVCFGNFRSWLEAPRTGVVEETPDAPYVPRERGKSPVNDDPNDLSIPEEHIPGAGRVEAPTPNYAARRGRRDDAGEELRRFASGSLREDEKELFGQSKELLVAGLGRLRQALDKLDEDFKELVKRKVTRIKELRQEINAQRLFLQELIQDAEFVSKGDEANYVYWAQRSGRRGARLVAAPLDIAPILHDQLFDKRRAIALVSATLSLRDQHADAGSGFAPLDLQKLKRAAEAPGERATSAAALRAHPDEEAKPHPKSFEYVKQRLGLTLTEPERLDEVLEGSPFDYPTQCRFYVPTFLPEPSGSNARAFNDALPNALAALLTASGGRALVLYTSYEALQSSARSLRKVLAPEGIEVLAQKEDGSREALLAKLQAGGRTVLLGTSSFWEGVDVPGDALSLLVIVKLPFAVFTDPLVEGRCELLERQGKDPFLHYSVPQAILKLRQGFGRLIRSKTDRGVVVLCDKRVLTKRYGAAFLRALPVAARKANDLGRMADEIRHFLDQQASK